MVGLLTSLHYHKNPKIDPYVPWWCSRASKKFFVLIFGPCEGSGDLEVALPGGKTLDPESSSFMQAL